MTDVGNSGHYWTAEGITNGYYSYGYKITGSNNSGQIENYDQAQRVYGRTVRCVKEY